MRLAMKFILIVCMSVTVFSQNPDINISNDVFLNIYYNRGQIILTDEKLNIVDNVAMGIINNKISNNYSFRIELGTCEYEKKKDRFISYKRLEHLFNYFENKYGVEREKFQFDFSDSEFCYAEQEDNISFVNFALQNCQILKKSDIEVGNIFENVFYAMDSIIPTAKGKRQLENLATVIKNNKISNKYSIRVQIAICDREKKNNPFITYERIEYLLDYLEKEFEIKKEKMQFEFINNNQENKTSFIKFVLLCCR